MKINISIIGLGRVGSILLQEMLKFKNKGVNIVSIAEINETPGKLLAREKNIKIQSLEEIAKCGNKVDLIFELTGNMDIRRHLRNILRETNNNHSVVATETIATLICVLLSDKELPNVHNHTGY